MYQMGVLVVGHCNGIIQIRPQLTPVAMVTKLACCHESWASAKQHRVTVTLGFVTLFSSIFICIMLAVYDIIL